MFSKFSEESKIDEYYERVKRMNDRITEYKRRIELYNSREV